MVRSEVVPIFRVNMVFLNHLLYLSGKLIMIWCSSRKHTYIILTSLKPQFYTVKLGFTGVFIVFSSPELKAQGELL